MPETDKISAALTDADLTLILAAITTIRSKMPFIITLAVGEKATRVMGSKSVDYVNLGLEGAKDYPKKLTADFDLVEFTKDVTLINQLEKVRIPLTALVSSICDTINAAGSDAIRASDEVYDSLKKSAKKDGTGKDLVARMGAKYEGQKKPRKPKTPKPPTT